LRQQIASLNLKTKRLRLAIALAVIAGAGVASLWIKHRQRYDVDALISRFQAHPDPATAGDLCYLLDKQMVSRQDGQRILECLLKPQITVRDSYPVGAMLPFALTIPWTVHFRSLTAVINETVLEDKATGSQFWNGSLNGIEAHYNLVQANPFTTPGDGHTVGAHYEYALTPARTTTDWQWPVPATPFPKNLIPAHYSYTVSQKNTPPCYQAAFDVSAQIRVVEPAAAETVSVVSNTSLNATMRSAISSKPTIWRGTSVPHRWTKSISLTCSNLPESAAFAVSYRDSSGAETPLPLQTLLWRRGTTSETLLMLAELASSPTGSYTGTIVLRHCADCAYYDPAIKTIWAGDLAFPISFEIE
jgi:hypothetical protein